MSTPLDLRHLPLTHEPDPTLDLAQALGDVLRRQHLLQGGAAENAEAVRLAALLASLAVSVGHCCASLADPELLARLPESPPPADTWIGQLRGSPVVAEESAPVEPRPLVLAPNGALYLYRYWNYERRLAEALTRLNRPIDEDPERLRPLVDALFPGAPERPDRQKLAAATAISRRLAVISGGPGTGKTTTVAKLLAALLSLHPTLRVALAAPTGKAAARLLDAIRAQIPSLPVDEAIRQRFPNEAGTLHRLLGYRPDSGHFLHGPSDPLAADLVVADEASMIDLHLATALVEAVPPHGRLILLGDRDQLASVETGVVFAEICAARGGSPEWRERLKRLTGHEPPDAEGEAASGLADAIVSLRHNYRFGTGSAIAALARLINTRQVEAAGELLAAGSHDDLAWEPRLPERDALTERLAKGYAEFIAALRAGAGTGEVLERFGAYRVLAAARSGPFGVAALNAALTEILAPETDPHWRSGSAWYHGRPVMVTQNDYALRVFNGDLGIALRDRGGQLSVWFPAEGNAVRSIPCTRLAATETAYVLTVHKSQGSEFARIDVVLPAADSPLLTRELLYTAITRASRAVRIWGPKEVVAAAIARTTRRHSRLAERLAALSQESPG